MSGERWHGTPGGYSNHKCRCEPCRKANREYMRRYRGLYPSSAKQQVRYVLKHKAINREGERRGVEWTSAELEFITARDKHGKYLRSAKSAALTLGRSVLAVERARNKCRTDPRYIALLGAGREDETALHEDWPVCWCALSPGYGHLWHPRACPSEPVAKDAAAEVSP